MNKHAFRTLCFGLLTASALSGCASAGATEETPSVDAAPFVGTIAICRTTLAELRKGLGEPNRDGSVHGRRVLTWITAWHPLVRYVGVLLNEQDVVVDMYWNAPSEIPWNPEDQCRGR